MFLHNAGTYHMQNTVILVSCCPVQDLLKMFLECLCGMPPISLTHPDACGTADSCDYNQHIVNCFKWHGWHFLVL
jgi:hypothetical protein